MRKTLVNQLSFLLFFVLLAGYAQAQIDMPQPSPLATVSQRVGLTDVSITYSRPSVKGRKIFGEMEPYGKMWRTGANAATVFRVSDNVKIEGKDIPAGEYALFTIPNKNEWTIILNKNSKLSGTSGYKQEEDVARFNVKAEQAPAMVETFTINFANVTTTAATVQLMWENTMVQFRIETQPDAKVMAQIREQVINGKDVSPNMYAQAASYYYDTNKDPKQALEWINKATAKDPKFWQLHTKAKIQAQLKDYKGAIATAEQSKKLAAEAKNDQYVKMNEKLIADWKKAK